MLKCAMLSVALLAVVSRAAAGTCPSGANYLNTTNPTGSLVTLASLNITNCFFIAANGSDTNTGADESHPWLNAPGMTGCASNCLSNTPSGGRGYIFRGGDTWHMGNSGLSPYTNGWTWSWSGTSQTTPIYIGIDPGWYSGGSWTRPILSADNSLNGCAGSGPCNVANCSYFPQGSSSNQMVTFNGVAWNVFDEFEFTGLCWNNDTNWSCCGANTMLSYYAPSANAYYFVIERNYFHGWSHTSGSGLGHANAMQGNSNQGYGVVIQFNVVDGSDSDDLSMSALGGNDTNLWITRYNYFGHTGGDVVASDCHYIHDNIFEYFNTPFTIDNSGHGDLVFCEAEYAGGSSSPNVVFNNVWRNIGTEYDLSSGGYLPGLATPSGQTDYIFNNVWHDNQPTSASNYVSDENRVGTWTLFNNTGELISGGGAGCLLCSGSGAIAAAVNNHWIAGGSSTPSQSAIFKTAFGGETHALYMSNTTATSDGYTSSNDFAPTSAANPTVGAGSNETSVYCGDSVLHYAIAETECVNGTSKAISYNSTSHSVSYPGITLNARPSSGAWDVGAYEFLAGATGAGTNAKDGLGIF